MERIRVKTGWLETHHHAWPAMSILTCSEDPFKVRGFDSYLDLHSVAQERAQPQFYCGQQRVTEAG